MTPVFCVSLLQFERRWDATAAVCRALLDIFVEADAQQQGRASTGASSSTGSSSTNSGGSNGAAATLCDAAAAPAPGDSAAQRCQALLRVRLPASGEECWCVVAAAAKYGHIEAWRDFKERGVGSSHRAPPSFSLGLSHQVGFFTIRQAFSRPAWVGLGSLKGMRLCQQVHGTQFMPGLATSCHSTTRLGSQSTQPYASCSISLSCEQQSTFRHIPHASTLCRLEGSHPFLPCCYSCPGR